VARTIRSDAPAGFVPEAAIALTDRDGIAVPIGPDRPLPVTIAPVSAAGDPLAGTAAADALAGPFAPELARAIWVTLTGDWSGTVTVQRSTGDVAARRPLTAGGVQIARFRGNAQEPIAEETVAGATYWLEIAITSGTLSYRVQQ
jgi:hypothetical protein